MNYDPNLFLCGRITLQQVELTFRQWDYSKTVTIPVRANVSGYEAIEAAIEIYDQQLLEAKPEVEGEIVLDREDGEQLSVELWENKIADMLTSARILSVEIVEGPKL